MRVAICGGAAIGASTAYFLAQRGVACTVIERTAARSGAVALSRRLQTGRAML